MRLRCSIRYPNELTVPSIRSRWWIVVRSAFRKGHLIWPWGHRRVHVKHFPLAAARQLWHRQQSRDYRKLSRQDHALRSACVTGPRLFLCVFFGDEIGASDRESERLAGRLLDRASARSFRRGKMLFILPMPLDSISKWQSTRPWQMSPMPNMVTAVHQPSSARARTRQRCIIVKPKG